MNLLLNSREKYKDQINYIFNFIFQNINLENEELSVVYGKTNKPVKSPYIYIYRTDKIFTKNNYLKKKLSIKTKKIDLSNYKNINKGKFTSNNLNIFFKDDFKNRTIEFENGIIKLNFDILSAMFYMLTRYEEYMVSENQLDEHDRFPAQESVAYKNGFLDRPLVDEYIELLIQLINWLGIDCKWKNIWDNNDFSACLTHDIDHVKKFKNLKNIARPFAKKIIKDKSINSVYKLLKNYIETQNNYKKDPFWTFDYIIENENKYKFNSSFYFMASNNKIDYDCNYDISSKKIQNLFKQIEYNNNEIGIHPNYFTYNNNKNFSEQVKLLRENVNNKIFGGRQHYLRFDIKKTFDLYEKNGLLYDSTMAFADIVGFRCGTSHPFKVFSLSQNKELNLWEIPLIVMESTLKSKKYMDFKPIEALELIKLLINKIKKYHGVFTLLWHNSSFTGDWEDWEFVYKETLKYIYKKNGKGMSGKDIVKLLE